MNTLFADNNLFRRVGSIALARKIIGELSEYEANTKDRLSLLVKHINFDRIVLSTSLVRHDIMSIIKRIKKQQKKAKILIINEFEQEVIMYSDLQHMIDGNISVNEPITKFEEGLKSFLLVGEYYCEQLDTHDSNHQEIPAKNKDNLLELLSANERKIIMRLVHGERVSDIAHSLQLSISTISTYKTRAFRKLGIENISQLKILLETITSIT